MAATHHKGPIVSENGFTGDVTGNLIGRAKLTTYTVATLPSAASVGAGTLAYCSNGAAGQPVVVFSTGAAWLRVDTLAAAAAS